MEIYTVDQLLIYYPDMHKQQLKTTWSNKRYSKHLKLGFKHCTRCGIMIKTIEDFCRICGKKFRCNARNKKWRKKK